MGDLYRQRRLADAANALERRILFIFSARLFARSSDQGRLEDLLRSLLSQARSLSIGPQYGGESLAGRRSSQEFRGKLRGRSGSSTFSPQIVRQLAAVSCKYHHDLFVKPDIHRGGIIGIAIVVKLLCEFLTRKETAVDGKSFIRSTTECLQSSFGVSPIELLSFSLLKASSTAATSTDGPSGADDEVGAGADGAAFVVPLA